MTKKEKIEALLEKHKDVPNIKDIVDEARRIEIEDFEVNHKPIWDLDNFKEYKRHMIMLRPDMALLLHIFKRDMEQNIEDAWLDDNESYMINNYECIKDSAHQLMLQLEGHYCQMFLEELKKEVDAALEHENRVIEEVKEKYNIKDANENNDKQKMP